MCVVKNKFLGPVLPTSDLRPQANFLNHLCFCLLRSLVSETLNKIFMELFLDLLTLTSLLTS